MSWIITYPPEYYLQLGGSGAPTETRYIATLKASDGGYIKLAQPIDIGANDDFEITYVFATDAPAHSVLIGNGTTRLFRIEPNGELRAYCGVMNLTSTTTVNDGKLHTATVKRIGNVFSLKVDNENELSVDNVGVFGALLFDEITKHGTSYSNVTPLELKSTTLNTLTHHYDFNVAKGTTIIPNLAQPLGSELWNDSDVSTLGAVYPIQDGWHFDLPDSANAELTIVGALEVGKTYLVSLEIYDRVTGGVAWNSSGWTPIPQQMGVHELLVKATSTSIKITRAGSGTNLKLRNITVKEAPNWAEYINVTDDNKELYTWNAEQNAWIGNDTGKVLEVAQ